MGLTSLRALDGVRAICADWALGVQTMKHVRQSVGTCVHLRSFPHPVQQSRAQRKN